MLLLTCRRWDRATGRLIAAIEADGLLADDELDELAESFLREEVEIVYPLAWVSPQWLKVDIQDPTSKRTYRVDENTPARTQRRIAPPLRRWAPHRALGTDRERFDQLLSVAERLDRRGRAAVILGLLDAAAILAAQQRRRLVRVGLEASMARVRRAALELLCELEGPDTALPRALSDPDANVRAWRPRSDKPGESLSLL